MLMRLEMDILMGGIDLILLHQLFFGVEMIHRVIRQFGQDIAQLLGTCQVSADGAQAVDKIHEFAVLFIHHIDACVEFIVPNKGFYFFLGRCNHRIPLSVFESIQHRRHIRHETVSFPLYPAIYIGLHLLKLILNYAIITPVASAATTP